MHSLVAHLPVLRRAWAVQASDRRLPRYRRQELTRASSLGVLHEHFVLGRDDLVDRGEVAGAVPGDRAVAEMTPYQPEQRSEQRSSDEEAGLVPVAEQGERDPDEQPDPESGQGLRRRSCPGSDAR